MRNWKEYLYYTRTERRGILLLAVLIIITCLLPRFFLGEEENYPTKERTLSETDSAFAKEYQSFLASIRTEKQKSRFPSSTFAPKDKAFFSAAPTLNPFPFNPNTADSLVLLRLGLPSWLAKNVLNYRRKGGKFRRAEDFKRIYGLSEKQYAALSPYISIPPPPATSLVAKDTLPLLAQQEIKKDTVYKYPAGTVIDLNQADTTELKKIPGIGSAIARMIVNYRNRLGYYCRIEQLKEIHLRAELLRPWFTMKEISSARIDLNRASVQRIMRHPYFNFYQARIIVEHRAKYGKLQSLQDVSLYKEFTEEDIKRQTPYVIF